LGEGIEHPTFIHLNGSFDLIEARLKARQHKYMPTSLLRSQFETLEAPIDAIILTIDAPLESVVDEAFTHLSSAQPKALIEPVKK
jgi:gluconokinase